MGSTDEPGYFDGLNESPKVKLDRFAADMKAQGIHVGVGSNPHCVTCGEAWPCAASKEKK